VVTMNLQFCKCLANTLGFKPRIEALTVTDIGSYASFILYTVLVAFPRTCRHFSRRS
jgi:hypothetical protein